MKTANLFTFAICAYKDSPYLEDAILSAKRQSIPVEILIATSTPSDYIAGLAAKHQIEYIVNPHRGNIATDWEFALAQVKTPYAAILHQDDIYFENYAEKVMEKMLKHPDTLITFTDYGDLLSDGKIHSKRGYLIIKRMLLWAFYLKKHHRCRWGKRSALVLGNAISCPTVSYNLQALKSVKYDQSYSVNLDWAKWLELADLPGAFAFVPEVLMAHRIDDSMETAAAIADNRRYNEDRRIFEKIWGKTIAGFLMFFYKNACKANQV
ncbi:MAG: glycosyltransferase family 2 protein [Lentisphaerae bacterium]|nr:glycosyltransferase family 2 protein [Lentisphaerota bacterium]